MTGRVLSRRIAVWWPGPVACGSGVLPPASPAISRRVEAPMTRARCGGGPPSGVTPPPPGDIGVFEAHPPRSQDERVAPNGTLAERKSLQPILRGCDGERI